MTAAARGPERRTRPTAVLFLLTSALLTPVLLTGACTEPQGGLSALKAPEKLAPTPDQTYLALGRRYLVAREPDMAMKAFQVSLAAEGVTAEAMTGAGIAARQQGLLHEARRYMERAVVLAPDSPIAQYNLGVVQYQLNEYHAARNAFRSAFALSSGTSELAAQQLNRTEEIIALLEQRPDVDPTISHDVVALGGGEYRLVASDRAETQIADE